MNAMVKAVNKIGIVPQSDIIATLFLGITFTKPSKFRKDVQFIIIRRYYVPYKQRHRPILVQFVVIGCI